MASLACDGVGKEKTSEAYQELIKRIRRQQLASIQLSFILFCMLIPLT